MLRLVITVLSVVWVLQAAVLPEGFGEYRRGAESSVPAPHEGVWKEFGFETAARAEYTGPSGQAFTLTAYRFADPTGAFAAFQWQRPADAQSSLTSASTDGGALIQHQNYLLQLEGNKPHPATLEQLYGKLPKIVRASLPFLHEYLPRKGRVANSERYVLGPWGLAQAEPRISAELASFGKGAEAQSAKYVVQGRPVQLTILSYPTPQIAMERARALERLPAALVRRSGPMVMVMPETAGFEPAEKMLTDINYSASITWNEAAPKDTVQDAAEMILAISVLAAALILLSILLGTFFGGSKILMRRFGIKIADEDLTTLNLSGK